MFVQANFVDIYSQGMCDRSMRSGTGLAPEIKQTDWSMARNLSNRSSGVQIPCDICTHLKRYLYSVKCSWIIKQRNLCLPWIASRRLAAPCLPFIEMLILAESAEGGRERAKKQPTLVGSLK